MIKFDKSKYEAFKKTVLTDLGLQEKLNLDLKFRQKDDVDIEYDEYDNEIDRIPFFTLFIARDLENLIELIFDDNKHYMYCDNCKRMDSFSFIERKKDEELMEEIKKGLYCNSYENIENLGNRIYTDREKNEGFVETDENLGYKQSIIISNLLKKYKYFSKILRCPNCHEKRFYYKLEFCDEKNELSLIKLGSDVIEDEVFMTTKIDSEYSEYDYVKSKITLANKSSRFGLYIGGFIYLRQVFEHIINSQVKNIWEINEGVFYNKDKTKMEFTKGEKVNNTSKKKNKKKEMYYIVTENNKNCTKEKLPEKIDITKFYMGTKVTIVRNNSDLINDSYDKAYNIYSSLSEKIHVENDAEIDDEEIKESYSILQELIECMIEEISIDERKKRLRCKVEEKLKNK